MKPILLTSFLIHNDSPPLFLPRSPTLLALLQPLPFYFLQILASELLEYCSQLLTVEKGDNVNDPLKQLKICYQEVLA